MAVVTATPDFGPIVLCPPNPCAAASGKPLQRTPPASLFQPGMYGQYGGRCSASREYLLSGENRMKGRSASSLSLNISDTVTSAAAIDYAFFAIPAWYFEAMDGPGGRVLPGREDTDDSNPGGDLRQSFIEHGAAHGICSRIHRPDASRGIGAAVRSGLSGAASQSRTSRIGLFLLRKPLSLCRLGVDLIAGTSPGAQFHRPAVLSFAVVFCSREAKVEKPKFGRAEEHRRTVRDAHLKHRRGAAIVPDHHSN